MPSEPAPRIALIAAVADNGVIGAAGGIPWRLRSDMGHFKALTMGHTLVMGRATYVSIGRPLPGRRTIVVTRGAIDGVPTVASLEAALSAADRPVFLAGGARIYAEGMAHADTIFLTRVAAAPEGDTFFPPIDPAQFALVSRDEGTPGAGDDHAFAFLEYRRL
ncbi:MAG: dihydrofolate reductase [Acuticoccus sp.]